MKKLKLIALTAIAFVIITSMIFVSCQKQNEFISTSNGNNPTNINKRLTLSEENGVELLSEANTYQKEITVYDVTNTYSVKFNVSSNDEKYLTQYLSSQTLTIVVLMSQASDVSNVNVDENPSNISIVQTTNSIQNILLSTNLPNDAAGFKLNIRPKTTRYNSSFGSAEGGYQNVMEFTTLANGILTTNNSGATGMVEQWAKKYSYSSWNLKGVGNVSNGSQYNFCIKNFNRIKVQINYNNSLNNYNVTFYGSSSC
jgi:hypothetical protein